MLRKGSLHAHDPEPLADGTYLAVTLMNRPPHGVMAWAGTMHPNAVHKQIADIEIGDYDQVEKISFGQWTDVWDYFAGRQYERLVAQLRADVERLYPGE